MTIIEVTPVEFTALESVPKPEELVDHYVCCDIPDGWIGMTKTFCGTSVFFEGRDSNAGQILCPLCVERARYAGCPLGNDCVPIR